MEKYIDLDIAEYDLEEYMVIIEDDAESAKDYLRHSGLEKRFPRIYFVYDLNTLNAIVDNSPFLKVFWVDINMGIGRETEGLQMIEVIRRKTPDALIVVYSGNIGNKKKSLELGADHFFVKGAYYEKTMEEIGALVENYFSILQNKEPRYTNNSRSIEYAAQIAHIDEKNNWVKLECHINDKIIERIFDSGPVEEALKDDFFVDAWVMIKIIKNANEIKIVFEKKEDSPNVHDPEDDDILSDDELIDSKIWRKDRSN